MNKIIETLSHEKLVPVVVINDAEKALPLARSLIAGGCHSIEITFRTAAAKEAISRIAKGVPEMLIGAGTLLTKEQVAEAKEAGAAFGVAPGFSPRIAEAAKQIAFPFCPGVSTASEMTQAIECGCLFQKFFPAEAAGGTKMLKSVLAALKHTGVKIMPTGGINADNISSWLEIPEVVACGASWICESKLIDANAWDEITTRTKIALTKISK